MRRPCGVYSRSYAKDKAIFRTKTQWVLLLVALVLLSILPILAPPSIRWMITFFIQLIAVLGLMLLTGYCGQISLGQTGFMAIGAFASAILVTKAGLPFWLSLLCAILASVVFGVIFGLPALRIKGFYLALSTLAAHHIIIWIINHGGSLTGGPEGMRVARIEMLGFTFDTSFKYYYLCFGFAVLFTYFAQNLARSRLGRAWIAIRDNDIAAETIGINLTKYKLVAFGVAAAYAGVSGALWAHYVPAINYEHFSLWDSIWFLAMIVIGGLGTIPGAIFGTAFIRVLDEVATVIFPILQSNIMRFDEGAIAGVLLAAYGLAVVLFLIFEPRGIAHRWEMFKSWYRLWPFTY